MNMTDNQLDHLFKEARDQKPVASFDETQKAFLKATVVLAGGVLATKGLLKLFTIKKWILMFSAVSVVTTGAVVVSAVVMGPSEPQKPTDPMSPPAKVVTAAAPTIEIPQKNEEERVYHFDEKVNLDTPLILAPPPVALAEVKEEDTTKTVSKTVSKTTSSSGSSQSTSITINSNENNTTHSSGSGKSTSISINSNGRNTTVTTRNGGGATFDERFVIDQNTSKEELELIKQKAQAAGIDFSYSVKHRGGTIRSLTMEMYLKRKGEEDKRFKISNNNHGGSFRHVFGWTADKKGKAENILLGDDRDEDDQGMILEIDPAEWNEMAEELASLTNQISTELSEELALLSEQLAEKSAEIRAELMENSEYREDMEKMVEELRLSAKEIKEEIESEIRELEKEIEREQKEKKEQKEKQ